MTYTVSLGARRQLVSETTTYYRSDNAYQVPETAPSHWFAGFITGLVLAGLLFLFLNRYNKKTTSGKYLFGVYHIFLGFIFGIPGFVLFIMSLFTDHIVTYYNENLFLANPLSLLLIIAGYGIFRQKKSILKHMSVFTIILLLMAVILLVLKIFPAFDQDNLLAIVSITPVLIALAVSLTRLVPKGDSL